MAMAFCQSLFIAAVFNLLSFVSIRRQYMNKRYLQVYLLMTGQTATLESDGKPFISLKKAA